MLEQQMRRAGKNKIIEGNRMTCNKADPVEIAKCYAEGIKIYSEIPHKNKSEDDFIFISEANQRLAALYFNARHFSLAAHHYYACIEDLLTTKPDDRFYRELTKRYIDLSDACCEYFNFPGAQTATLNAISAFKLIQRKNSDELLIGNSIVSNFSSFRYCYKQQYSLPSYLASPRYLNNERLLGMWLKDINNETPVSNQAEKMDLDLNTIQVNKSPIDKARPFTPIILNAVIQDSDLRSLGIRLLDLSQSYVTEGFLAQVRTVRQQALAVFESIKKLEVFDTQAITGLKNSVPYTKVGFFSQAPVSIQNQTNTNTTTSLRTANNDSPDAMQM